MDPNDPVFTGPSPEEALSAEELDPESERMGDRTPTKAALKILYRQMHNKPEFYEQVLAIMYRMDLPHPFGPQRPRPVTGCLAAPEGVPRAIQKEDQSPTSPPLNHKDIRSATDLQRRLISYIFKDCNAIFDKEMELYNRPRIQPPATYSRRRNNPPPRPSGSELIKPTFFRVLWSIADANEHRLIKIMPYVATLEEEDIELAIHSATQVLSIPPPTVDKVPLPTNEFTGHRKVLYSAMSRSWTCLKYLKRKLARLPEKTVEGEMHQNAPKAVIKFAMGDQNYKSIQDEDEPIPSTKLVKRTVRLREKAEKLKKEEEEKAKTKPKRRKGGQRLAAKAKALALRKLSIPELLRLKEPGQLTMSARPPLPRYRHLAHLLPVALPPNWDGPQHPWDVV
ncbi:hypothetical protein EMPS_06876 [Entomortierella parvispora]|uniref:Uncharacterized protein n=1 Tax=Entomortierella parvispora TaxID=205924 RepID=A0A9P3HDJ3_9FUNG|nr:hypothetical protein EMPS_06876 [Entomortierella parvispora]